MGDDFDFLQVSYKFGGSDPKFPAHMLNVRGNTRSDFERALNAAEDLLPRMKELAGYVDNSAERAVTTEKAVSTVTGTAGGSVSSDTFGFTAEHVPDSPTGKQQALLDRGYLPDRFGRYFWTQVADDAPHCQHGVMAWIRGTSKTGNKPYQGYFCSESFFRKSDCTPVFGVEAPDGS